MELHKLIRYIQYLAISIIFVGSFIGFSLEVIKMIGNFDIN